MRTAHTGEGINVMTQALHAEDGSLPQGLTVQNVYMELQNDSNNVTVVVRNSMVYPQTLKKKTPGAREVMVTRVPELQMHTDLTEASEEAHRPQVPKLTMKQRQVKLFKEFDLSGLESWPIKLVASTWSILAKYHDVFYLEHSDLGCTHPTKHVIKVTNDTSFKECFRQIPPSLVEKVCAHL